MSVPSPAGRPLLVLALLTVVWGLNWPVMKLGVSGQMQTYVLTTLVAIVLLFSAMQWWFG